MKKLLTILSAAALATGAFADTATVESATETFEDFEVGVNVTTNTLTPNTAGDYVWYSAGDADEGETGTVTAYADGDAKPENGADSNAKYLNVSTTTGTPLYRTVSSHSGTITSADANPVDIGTGIFVDTYVQFSGSETAPQIPDGSKLVVWVQAIDDDDNGTTDNPADDIQGSTNLVVTAAMLDVNGVPTATNFVIETADDFNFEGWHRLTIRAIKDITSGTELAGFTVFVDGAQLAAKATQIAGTAAVIEDEVEVTPAVPAVTYNDLMGAYAYADNLTAEAKAFYNKCQLFVSLVGSNTYYGEASKTLSAVGFDGTGKIDDVTVSDDRSQFAFARGDFYFTMEWDAGITGFTLTANDAEEGAFTQTYTKTEAGSEVIVIPAAATTLTISAITVAEGSTYNGSDTIEVALLDETSYSLVTETTYVKIGDKSYSSFAAALADATAGATLKLVKPLTLNQTVLRGDIVLDLAGQTITYEAATLEDDVATEDIDESTLAAVITVAEGASLKIIDSVGEGMIQYEGEPDMTGNALIDAYSGTFILGDADDDADKGATIVGMVGDAGVAYAEAEGGAYAQYVRGKLLYIETSNGEYDADSDTYSAYFSSYLYVDGEGNTSSLECDGEYFVITPPTSGEPEVDTFAVTVTPADNATYTVTGADDLTAVESGTELTFTATAAAGYTYTGVELGDWTIDANDATMATYTVIVNEAMTVAIPVPAEITYAITLEGNANADCTYGEVDLGAVAYGSSITFTATAKAGYTYNGVELTGGWTLVDGNATYTLENITAAATVTVPAPAAITIQIFVSCTNCTCTADAADLDNVAYGSTVKFTATPKTGYTFDGAELNGWTLVDGNATYTLANVTANAVVAPPMAQLIVPVAGGEAPKYATEADATAAAANMDVSAADKDLGIDKSYFKTTVTGSDAAGWTVTTELNAEVVQPSTETAVKAIPEAIAAAAEGASITVNIPDVKAGLQYVVEVVTELGNLGNAENLEGKTWTRAGTDGNLALPVTKPTGGKGFFKVHVKH